MHSNEYKQAWYCFNNSWDSQCDLEKILEIFNLSTQIVANMKNPINRCIKYNDQGIW